ncbi:ribonuclease P protein component [Falsigemmobacter faecalis]|uniref:Ribonuclease P protein component n=1 Tax=Falsigemmobacter faecalis TaxID=2488730 RepID=A0A3P3DUM9_9RHOB|nr:ribonuclease P protein component [Falsigemmobacter faecalis]RRH77861.1 ribonuclease P protein component [Falsigemmobacter faecalis]
MNVLKLRSDFLRAAQARRQGTGGFLLQARERGDGSDLMRIGFTASKKVGNSVMRNLARRRMRELAREILVRDGKPGWDYVMVARPGATVVRDFAELKNDLAFAIRRVHTPKEPAPKEGAAKP